MTDTAPQSGVKVDLHEEPAWRRVLDIEVPVEAVAAAYSLAYKSLQKKAKVPGFRPGKVPRDIIQRRFGHLLEQEVLDTLVPQSLGHAYRVHRLMPVTDPRLSNLHLKGGDPLKFRAEIEVRPEIDAKGYDNLVLQKKKRAVTTDDVEQAIARLRERRAEFTPAERAATRGDVVICDLVETTPDRPQAQRQNMQDVTLEINPEHVFPEFADGLLGVKAGETRSVSLTYPQDYGNQDLAGRRVEFSITTKEVRERRLPELNDEFARGLAGEGTTLDVLRTKVREDLEAQVDLEAERELSGEIITRVLAANPFDLPPSLVVNYLDRLEADIKRTQPEITREEIEARYKEIGVRQVRWEFMYHAIADKENVTATDQDLDEWVDRFARQQGIEKEEARQRLSGSGQVARIRENILENKVIKLLRERSTVTELPISGSLITPPGGRTRS